MTLNEMLEDDLDIFVDTDEFGKEGTYTTAEDEETTLKGIFDHNHVFKSLGPYEVETTAPGFTVKTSLVSSAVVNETVTIDGTTYYIIGTEPSDDGLMTTLALSKDRV